MINIKAIVPKGFYTDVKAKEILKMMLGAAVSSLAALESYFDVPFFLPKLELLGGSIFVTKI